MSDAEEKGFTVVDRRASAGAADEPATPSPDSERERPTPAFDFSMLIQSVAITALHQLGIVAAPGSAEAGERNLPLARQNIEILELLEDKTRGNLDPDEAHLLSSLLYEVRMRYVEASKAAK